MNTNEQQPLVLDNDQEEDLNLSQLLPLVNKLSIAVNDKKDFLKLYPLHDNLDTTDSAEAALNTQYADLEQNVLTAKKDIEVTVRNIGALVNKLKAFNDHKSADLLTEMFPE